MKILITGCNGQLGSELRQLQAFYPHHTFLNTDVEELDITDELSVNTYIEQNEVDGIVNCAAYTAVDRAESDKEACTSLNTVAPALLATAIERRGGWMIHISTDYVFNGKAFRRIHLQYQLPNTFSPHRPKGENNQTRSSPCP